MNKKKIKKVAEFKKSTKEEIVNDRRHYLEGRTVEVIQLCESMVDLMFEMQYDEHIIRLKESQLNKGIKETLNGMLKTKEIIQLEHSRLCHNYNKKLRNFTRLKEKLTIEHGFNNDELNLMLTGKFDYLDWQDKQLDHKNIKKQIK